MTLPKLVPVAYAVFAYKGLLNL